MSDPRAGLRLGTVLGVEITIDYSWFVIFLLILWTMTFGVFPSVYPEQELVVYALMGAAATLLFFASLLAHELSHSLVARRRGLAVQGITLFIFGGMARATREFRTPGEEFVIAGVGPLASAIIAGLFWVIAWLSLQLGLPASVTAVASYLGFINLLLAVFNLVPGYPLDGGRILRAIVWKRSGDARLATRVATNGGRLFGLFLMAVGLLTLFGGNLVGGLWLLFIGWFIRNTADLSYRQFVTRQSFEDVTDRRRRHDAQPANGGARCDARSFRGKLRARRPASQLPGAAGWSAGRADHTAPGPARATAGLGESDGRKRHAAGIAGADSQYSGWRHGCDRQVECIGCPPPPRHRRRRPGRHSLPNRRCALA
jgi:Zn-dependent protease